MCKVINHDIRSDTPTSPLALLEQSFVYTLNNSGPMGTCVMQSRCVASAHFPLFK